MHNKITKAMILAAGEGTRLQPLTFETPKPLLPVGDYPLLVHQLHWLKEHGVYDIAVNLYHNGEKIETALGNGSQYGVNIHYSREEELLGTAGGLKRMEHLFDGTFFIVYGDILTDLSLSEMAEFHRENNAFMTIALFEAAKPWEVGIVEMDEDSMLLSFTEKPPKGSEKSRHSNGGVYVAEPGIFEYIPADSHYDFGYDVFPRLLADSVPLYGYRLEPEDYLIDIGTMDKYKKANDDVKKGKLVINSRKHPAID